MTLLTYSMFFNCSTKVLFHQRGNVKHYHCCSHQLLKEIFLHLYLCIQAITPVTTATLKEDLWRTYLSPIVCGPLMSPLIMVTSQLVGSRTILPPGRTSGRCVETWNYSRDYHQTGLERVAQLAQLISPFYMLPTGDFKLLKVKLHTNRVHRTPGGSFDNQVYIDFIVGCPRGIQS